MPQEFNREWSAECPRGQISFLMGRTHVCTTDAEIRAMIRERCQSAAATDPRWTEDRITEAEDYAIACMEDHRDLCREFRL